MLHWEEDGWIDKTTVAKAMWTNGRHVDHQDPLLVETTGQRSRRLVLEGATASAEMIPRSL